jgi:hypothetical protein
VAACSDLARHPSRHGEIASALLEATGELERHFSGHLRREEEVIFPALRRLLDRADDAEIVREMRARRRVDVNRETGVPVPSGPGGSPAVPTLGSGHSEPS